MKDPAWLMVEAGDVPEPDAWLSSRERRSLSSDAVPSRRRDWRLGRWAAKQLLLASAEETDGVDPAELEVLAAADGVPEAWLRGAPTGFSLSIGHRDGIAVALVAAAGTVAGCDIEVVEPRAYTFAADWFTPGELAFVDGAPSGSRDLRVTLVWSAKESALKALRQGLRLDTRDVEVKPSTGDPCDGDGWWQLAVDYAGRTLAGWWRTEGRWVLTTVIDPATSAPASVEKAWNRKEKIRCS